MNALPGATDLLRLFASSALTFGWLSLSLLARQLVRLKLAAFALSVLVMPLLAGLQLVHWLCLCLDEVLCRGYRQVRVEAPVFVLGIPRSGTTLAHRVLAEDPQFTTFTTWECVLAPSVIQRRLLRWVGRVDRRLGGHGRRLLDGLIGRIAASLDGIHPVSLDAPEEDYLGLLPVLGCFLQVVPFPFSRRAWRLGRLDRDMPPAERKRLLRFYRSLVQRHLYAAPPGQRFLSKNAAFASWAGSLAETFPDARFIACLREPLQVVPSQLSALAGGCALFGHRADDPVFVERLMSTLEHGYHHLMDFAADRPGQAVVVPEPALRESLAATFEAAYRQLGIECSAGWQVRLRQRGGAARRFRSTHRPTPACFGLSAEGIVRRFRSVYRRSDTPFGREAA